MSKLLGANWKTSVSGVIFTLAIAIVADPNLVAFLPDAWEPTIKGIAGLIAVLSGGTFAYQAKSKDVTGGTTLQTANGSVAASISQTESAAVNETKQAIPKT